MRILFVIPPLTQLNTTYPSTTVLCGFLEGQSEIKNLDFTQSDFSIELVNRLFSKQGLERIKLILQKSKSIDERIKFFLENFSQINSNLEAVVRFLQGKDPSLALRIEKNLPQGPRTKKILSELNQNNYIEFAFGNVGLQDKAKYLASLFIDEIAEVIKIGIDDRFELSKYAEKISASQISFSPILNDLKNRFTLIDEIISEITAEKIKEFKPAVVGLTIPFPGNLFGALRIAASVKKINPEIKIILGGGYVNTELRTLSDTRIFEFVDFITLDDGERPLLQILKFISGNAELTDLVRTFTVHEKSVKYNDSKNHHDIAAKNTGFPTYNGLNLDAYMSMFEMLNPMHRIWSDTRWNKLMVAHGCYWKKCNFCDVSLDYIGRYDPVSADIIIDRMQKIISETKKSGFHFTDEALPPASLRNISQRLIEREVIATWWGNLRFDKVFTKNLAELMSEAGCIAVTGGLEVASDRLLKLMNKGVDIEQVARVTKNFNNAGIRVHAYLMYGFPTETEQETIDSLEVVRQLFLNGCLDSAFWHRFSATAHSPIGKYPEQFGITLKPNLPKTGEGIFSVNDIPFVDLTGTDHDLLGRGLNKALYNYMHGLGLDDDVRVWFERKVPRTTIKKNRIEIALSSI